MPRANIRVATSSMTELGLVCTSVRWSARGISRILTSVPLPLAAVVMRLLAKRAAQSAEEMPP